MLIETDAPYLIPKDINSKPKNNRNEPMYLEHILSVVSNLINQDKKIVAQQTTKISKIYLDSKKIGISLSASAALINIATADKRPNNTVGLKLEKTKTKNPTITVIAVISTA